MISIVNPLPSMARVAGAILGLVALLAAMVLTASPASAHARLEVTSPKDGASLTATPPEVMLRFNEPIQEGLNRVTVKSGSKDATQGALQVEGQTVYQPLKTSMAPGSYTVTYKVVSTDGHPVSGSFSFAYSPPGSDTGAGSDPAAPTSGPSASATSSASDAPAAPSESSAPGSAAPSESEATSAPTSGSADPSASTSPSGTSSPSGTTSATDGETAQPEPSETSSTTSTDPTDAKAADQASDEADDEGTPWWMWAIAAAVIAVIAAGIGLIVRARRNPEHEDEISLEDPRE